MRSRDSLRPFVCVRSGRPTAARPERGRPRLHRHRFRGRRRVLLAVLVSGVLLVPLAEPALAADSVTYESLPEGVRLSPGETQMLFFRADDVVTYQYCDDLTGACVEQSATCAAASDDWRTMQEAAEAAWLVLTLHDHWKLRNNRPFDMADLVWLLKPDLPLSYYFLNPEIEFADPPNTEGGFGDPATHRDPAITDLLEELYTDPYPDDSKTDLVDGILGINDLYLTSSDPSADPRSIADALPPDLKRVLDLALADPVNNAVPPGTLDEIKRALRVQPSDDVEATLSYLNANIVNTGWLTRYIYTKQDRLEEMPHTLAYDRGELLHGLLELLGLPDFDLQHVTDMTLRHYGGQVEIIPAERAVPRMIHRCGQAAIPDGQSIQFFANATRGGGTGETAFDSDQLTAQRSFGSIAPVNGKSSETARHVLGGTLWWDDISLASPIGLVQDRDQKFWVGPWLYWDQIPNLHDRDADKHYYLNRSHLYLRKHPTERIFYHILYGTEGANEVIVKTIDSGHLQYQSAFKVNNPNAMTNHFELRGGQSTEATMGGTITLTGNELGEETVRYCVGNITSGNCEEWVNSTVVVEPEGWDDARVVAVNDEYRLIVNLDSLSLALLRESADGDTTIGGTTYEVLTRLCCLAAGNEYWSVDLELPVMDNDRVVFFREGHPVNKSGHQILFDDLIDGDTIACTGSRFCTMMRPQPDVVPPGIFGMVVGPSYTSLELTVSAPTGNVISEQRVFNYCLAHRENSCGTSPPTCAKATYVESPRAPNAPNLPGIESSENLPARYFEATTLCAGTSGTVTLSVDVYEADDPGLPLIPEEVWETTFEDEFGASRRARCYDRDSGSWSFWTLNPGAAADRMAPSWCDLPPREEVIGLSGRYLCQPTRPDTYVQGRVAPAAQSRWHSALHVGAFDLDAGGWVRVGDDLLYLVGHRLTPNDGEMCDNAVTRIVGVWPTHVGADNWILRGADSDQPCTRENGYDLYGETSCLASQGNLWQQSLTGGLGSAWHAQLDRVEPCVGEAECSTWVPPVPGWYQVRVELDAPSTQLIFPPLVPGCEDAFDFLYNDPGNGNYVTTPIMVGVGEWTCRKTYRDYVNWDGRWVSITPQSRGGRLVFDDLIWVEGPYLVRR